jgi:hypothetical protein
VGLARNFPDVLRHRISRQPAAEGLDKFHTTLFGDLEVGRSRNMVELVQIIRKDAEVDESFAQTTKRVD